jgi:hypothetical protein
MNNSLSFFKGILMKVNLPRCPFCNGDNIKITRTLDKKYLPMCCNLDCFCSLKACDTLKEAVTLWSTRRFNNNNCSPQIIPQVLDILKGSKPLKVSDIYEELKKRNIYLSGATPTNSLTSILVRAKKKGILNGDRILGWYL